MDIRKIVVARSVKTYARGLGLEAQDGIDVLFLDLCAQSSPFYSPDGIGTRRIVGLAGDDRCCAQAGREKE
jgi:hypothetical protein